MFALIKDKRFWFGFAAGVVTWQVILPKFAPGIKAKLPLG